MIKTSSQKIAEILQYNGEILDTIINDISTDSRKISQDSLFIAIKGEKFDGHDFIKEVLDKGAPLVVAKKLPEGVDKKRVIIVKDTLKAFGEIAKYNRMQYKGKVIALTGSSGKTTTKEELKLALSAFGKTYATTANYNNHIGVPRSLLDIEMDAKFVIIEMGMSAPKEIEYLATLTQPDIAIVTNVYPMHIEFLKTIENIAHAKAEIFKSLKENGIAIYNKDTNCSDILKSTAQKYTQNIYEYGKDKHSPYSFIAEDNALHNYYNGWCVLETIKALGLDEEKASKVISKFTALEGRGKKYTLNINNKKITLIDNSYSGGPDATILAIDNLGKMESFGRKIAIIGKMAELGAYTKQAHKNVGIALKNNNIDVVIGVCEETKDMLKELSPTTTQYYFKNIEGISEFLEKNIIKDNDIILIKGSHYSSQVYKIAQHLKEIAN